MTLFIRNFADSGRSGRGGGPIRLNKTGVISPRYNVRINDFEKWVVKLLPSRQFGHVVLTTSSGIMDHEEARRKHVAGKIIGFFY